MTATEPGERAAGSEGLIGAGSPDAPAAPPSVPAAAEQMAPERGKRRLDGHPTSPLVLLSLVTLVNQTDPSILPGVLPLIQDDWGLADWQPGSLEIGHANGQTPVN